jgi:hypothetical protein
VDDGCAFGTMEAAGACEILGGWSFEKSSFAQGRQG